MKLKSIFTALAGLAAGAMIALGSAQAAEEDGGTPHFPIKHPKHVHWSFAGPFGHWDLGQLQRGLKVYQEVCSACHGLELVAFRNLEELGYSEEQVKAFASEYTVTDGPNAEGEMFERPAVPADRFPSPFPNEEAAAYANNGAAPPDFSLLAKARAPERGFPTFIFDVFTLYAENGPDYIYSLLTGYEDVAPEGVDVPEGTHYNPYFIAGATLAMAPPLSEGIVTYDDGTAETVDQYSRDVAAFMMWAAEPSLVERKSLGFKVMIALLLLAILFYLSKKAVWSALYSEGASSSARAVPATASAAVGSAPRAGVDFIDDIELIDGIGPTIAKRLKSKGVKSLAKIAAMSAGELDKLAESVNAKNRPVREEWQAQARELIAGKPPRAAIDRAKVEKLLGKKF